MSTRIDRYQAAIVLAQEILQGDSKHDQLRIQQALDDLVDEVRAGRRNQAEFPVIAAKVVSELWSVKAPRLELVKGDD